MHNEATPQNELSTISERIIELIYANQILYGFIDAELWVEITRVLEVSLEVEGLKELLDPSRVEFMRQNINYFSGFKTFNECKEMSAALLNPDGTIKTFAKFKKDALKVAKTYNVAYLNSEYNHAKQSAIMASKWGRIEQDKDLADMLVYQTAGDERVRPTHKAWDGTTLPVGNVFWNTHYPPNGWRCRCTVIQESGLARTPYKDVKALPKVDSKFFANNVGKDGIVFPESHPYFDVTVEERAYITRVIG